MSSLTERSAALAAVQINGDALMQCSTELKDDKELVLVAVTTSVDTLLWASPRLREDKDVLLKACSSFGRAIRYTDNLRADRDVALAAVAQDGNALQMVSGASGLRDDIEVVRTAVENEPFSLQYAGFKARADVAILVAAARQNPKVLKAASCADARKAAEARLMQLASEEETSTSTSAGVGSDGSDGSDGEHICVVVLGDLGRSPRMQYHGLSFAGMPTVNRVSLVGYEGEPCIAAVRNHKKIHDVRIRVYEPLVRVPIVHTLWRGISLIFSILCTLLSLPQYDRIIIQNPPAIPALLAAIVVECLRWTGSAQIILDWHNLGFAMFQEKLGNGHPLVHLSKALEYVTAKFVDTHLCVSVAMSLWLKDSFGVEATVLYDRPAAVFERQGTSVDKRHALLTKLQFTPQKLFHKVPVNSNKSGDEVTIQTTQSPAKKRGSGSESSGAALLADSAFIPIVVSSTSWTPDEDFSILLNALLAVEAYVRRSHTGKRVLVCVTGKGPMKDEFVEKIDKHTADGLLGVHIAIKTLWLEAEDYPVFMGCATLGVCLHTSTSGLDLPMKVLDMFGSGLPVCAVSFNTLPELIQHDSNGLIFDVDVEAPTGQVGSSSGSCGGGRKSKLLEKQLLHCLFNIRGEGESKKESGSVLLKRLKEKASQIGSWDENWLAVMIPLLASTRTTTSTTSRTLRYILKGVCIGMASLLVNTVCMCLWVGRH